MLSKRLKKLRRERGLTQAQLAKIFRVTQQAVAKWESARSVPDPETIKELAGFFGVSSDYLLGVRDSSGPEVKIIGAVRAGFGAVAYEEELGTAPAAVKNPAEYRYLVVKGDSMTPFIKDGDLALIKLQPTLNSGELGVVIYGDGEATLKRYRRAGDTVTLEPFNDEYETMEISGGDIDDLYVFGKVVQTSTRW